MVAMRLINIHKYYLADAQNEATEPRTDKDLAAVAQQTESLDADVGVSVMWESYPAPCVRCYRCSDI